MDGYINRTLTYVDEKGVSQRCADTELLSFARNVIVLGEPGIGKSELLRWIATQFGGTFRSAASFVRHPKPKQLLSSSGFIIVDGLDELAAAKETDPINLVLGKLIESECDRFILSCRSAEWRGAVARRELQDQYGTAPLVATLEGLSREDAHKFLTSALDASRAKAIVDSLDARDMEELYRNPLTLLLMRAIAQDGSDPHALSRAEILDRACAAMWHEERQQSDRSQLGLLDARRALDAAGACFASLILTGNDLLAVRERANKAETSLHHSEISALPGGGDILAVAGSRLFIPSEVEGHLKPIHRSVAEYLGAGWLAKNASDNSRRDRLLSLLTLDAGVPASLRGLHAWLPHFDTQFRDRVVSTDPYGVLIYGDPDANDPALGRALLYALRDLELSDPYFRSDWRNHSAKALALPELLNEVRSVIVDENTSVHLRTLLLQAVTGAQTTGLLREDLMAIVMGSSRPYYYAEREDAADVLLAAPGSDVDWPKIVEQLCDAGDHDSTRLAIHLIAAAKYNGISGQLLARAVLGHLGLLPGSETDSERSSSGTLHSMPRNLPAALIPQVLDSLAEELKDIDPEQSRNSRSELATFVIRAVLQYVRAGDVEPLRAAGWLRIVRGHHGFSTEDQTALAEFFAGNAEARHAIQRDIIYRHGESSGAWARLYRLHELNPGLQLTAEDAVFFLNEHASQERTPINDDVWLDLLSFSRRSDEKGGPIIEASRAYADGNPELAKRIEEFNRPRERQQWEIDDEKRTAAFDQKRAEGWAASRAAFLSRIDEIRGGGLRCVPAAQCYLGQFADIDRELSPPDRVGQWLGEELRDAALTGFEAALHRTDLPTLAKVSESYARSSRWNMVFPIVAGFAERIRNASGFDDLNDDLLLTIRLAIQNELLEELKAEIAALDEHIRSNASLFERYLRHLIEPSLRKNAEHVSGLYSFVRDSAYRTIAPQLAAEWLVKFADLPQNTEIELVDALINARHFELLKEVTSGRLAGSLNDNRRNLWLATQFLVDFEAFRAEFQGPAPRSLVWNIRHVMRGERLDDQPPVAVTPDQLRWVIQQFRHVVPKRSRPPGVTRGDDNDWDASDFLQGLINRLTSDLSREAADALRELCEADSDGYTEYMRHALDQQRRARREANFEKIELSQIAAIVEGRAPQSMSDLQTIVVQALALVQAEIRGSSTDRIDIYYDAGTPCGEEECTKRLMESIREHINPYGIEVSREARMAKEKRADLVFALGKMRLPVECKGQWHKELWDAARDQLEAFYAPDWRAEGRGIYVVYWFGVAVDAKHKPTKGPDGVAPSTASELATALRQVLGLRTHSSIAVEVLDLSR